MQREMVMTSCEVEVEVEVEAEVACGMVKSCWVGEQVRV